MKDNMNKGDQEKKTSIESDGEDKKVEEEIGNEEKTSFQDNETEAGVEKDDEAVVDNKSEPAIVKKEEKETALTKEQLDDDTVEKSDLADEKAEQSGEGDSDEKGEEKDASEDKKVEKKKFETMEEQLAKIRSDDPELKWYVVHTYSGYEEKAKKALEDRIRQFKKEKSFGGILIPTENVIEMVKGQKKTTTKRFFPGYILVKMILDEHTWHFVKNTPKITGFVGGGSKPPSVPEAEIFKITNQISETSSKPKLKLSYNIGEHVRVIDGPFSNFNGVVEEVKPDKGKLRVLVSIFGRATPVELDFVQVEKS